MTADDEATLRYIDRMGEFFRKMLLIRRFEEKAGQLYGLGKIEGYCHLSIGQEAVAVGTRAALNDGDKVIASYRNHGHALASGVAPEALMSELMGRADGTSGGQGGSMHIFSQAHCFFGGFAFAGSQTAVGAGVALAERLRGRSGVVACFIGERAAVQGQFSETLLLAVEHQLPIVFIVENNDGERLQEHVSVKDIGAPFGVSGETHDGADVARVRQEISDRAAACRRGAGPALVEFRIVRYRGHSMANPRKYAARPSAQIEKATRDPIDLVRDVLSSAGWEPDSFAAIEREVRAQVQAAADHALAAPSADPATRGWSASKGGAT